MPDREKVINGLEHEVARTELEWLDCVEVALLRDALALLKAQEPVKPTYRRGNAFCGKCGLGLHKVVEKNNFCPNCGRAVKWE